MPTQNHENYFNAYNYQLIYLNTKMKYLEMPIHSLVTLYRQKLTHAVKNVDKDFLHNSHFMSYYYVRKIMKTNYV